MGKFEFDQWLFLWLGKAQVVEFEWDLGNVTKNAIKHKVSIDEIESVFKTDLAIPIEKQFSPVVDEERFCIIGPSQKKALIFIVFTMRSEKICVISARQANQKEGVLYEALCKKT